MEQDTLGEEFTAHLKKTFYSTFWVNWALATRDLVILPVGREWTGLDRGISANVATGMAVCNFSRRVCAFKCFHIQPCQ